MPQYVTVARVRAALHELQRADPEIDAKLMMQRALQDDLVPRDARGRWRVSRLALIAVGTLTAAVGVFLYFSIR